MDEQFDQEMTSVVSVHVHLKTSARCHSRSHSQVRIEIGLEKPKEEIEWCYSGSLDCPVCTGLSGGSLGN